MPAFYYHPADVAPPPYDFLDFDSATFRLKPLDPEAGETHALQKLTDEMINDHIDTGENHFLIHQTEPRVLLTVSNFRTVRSEDASLGAIEYQEFVLSFAVFNELKEYDKSQLCAYIWVDGSVSGTQEYFAWGPSATGRELYGLPKTRGEIEDFETDAFTGTCHNFPVPPGGGTITPELAIRIAKADTDMSLFRRRRLRGSGSLSADYSLRVLGLLGRRTSELLDQIRSTEEKFAADPLWRKRELLRLFWGPLEGWPYAKRPDLNDDGDFALLNGGWSEGINVPLMGFRQLHNPVTHGDADHQQVIAAKFKYSKPHESLIANDYRIEIADAGIRDRLALEEVYDNIDGGTDAAYVANADADFADDVAVYA